jgi:hypothetical protein
VLVYVQLDGFGTRGGTDLAFLTSYNTEENAGGLKKGVKLI